ncbi:MAG: helix-turn-helix domain-containing protein [Deltaproteobacteria bacterium]|nr:helix-turn-helix domain-containing protein [Deltaproteobacteria bacterium]
MSFDAHFKEMIEGAVRRALSDWAPPAGGEPSTRSIPQLLTVDQTAERLAVHAQTVRAAIKSGDLPACRVFRAVRVREEDLDKFIREKIK